MQIITDLDRFPDDLRGGAISIGKFDGMHLGHSLILHRLESHAGKRQIPAVVMTFDPPPVAVLKPELSVQSICTLERKIELIGSFKVDAVIVVPTNLEFLQQSAETFFYETLQNRLHAQIVIEGKNFSFGRDKIGNSETVKLYGQWTGIEVDLVEPVRLGEKLVSSSGIRRLLQDGCVEQVNELMPQPYRLTGKVVLGEQRGRTLGFPTANLGEVKTIIPKDGIYATVARIDGVPHGSTTHIGSNPTFQGTEKKIEVFIHDFSGDLYGKRLDIDFFAYLREVVQFGTSEELINQMNLDIQRSQPFFRRDEQTSEPPTE
jgi:riboflavin kinase/FMN adenylyltransferase